MGNVTILYGIITDSKPFLRYNKQGNTFKEGKSFKETC